MVVTDMLVGLNVDNIADFACCHAFFNGKVKRRVAQYMANHHLVAVFAHAVHEYTHFAFVGRKGLFQKHIIAQFQKRHSGFQMLLVHCSVNDGVRKFRHTCQCVGIFKTIFLREPEHFLRFLAANGVGVSHADNF